MVRDKSVQRLRETKTSFVFTWRALEWQSLGSFGFATQSKDWARVTWYSLQAIGTNQHNKRRMSENFDPEIINVLGHGRLAAASPIVSFTESGLVSHNYVRACAFFKDNYPLYPPFGCRSTISGNGP